MEFSSRKIMILCVVISALLHFLGFKGARYLKLYESHNMMTLPVEFTDLPREDAQKLLAEARKSSPQPAPEPIPRKRGQVVETARPDVEKRPDKADYVSEYDSSVEKETRYLGPDEAGASAVTARAKQSERRQEEGFDGSDETGRNSAGPLMAEGYSSGEDGFQVGGGKRKGSRLSSLLPSAESLEQVARLSSHDYLPGVESGEGTAMNTFKWEGSSFFNRMKRSVSSHWEPFATYRQHDPTGARLNKNAYVTEVVIILDKRGKLIDVLVRESSGEPIFDRAFTDAIRMGAPFPNPPESMFDSDGFIRIPFAGVVEVYSKSINFDVTGAPGMNQYQFRK